MASASGALCILSIQSPRYRNRTRELKGLRFTNLGFGCRGRSRWVFVVRASDGHSVDPAKDEGGVGGGVRGEVEKNELGFFAEGKIGSLREMVVALPSSVLASQSNQGSVADLVRRGQLKSDRRGITKPLKYDDPFNNPLVKMDKDNSTIQMFGKVYRLAPVTLTKEQQSIHQKRRSRAYQWKRPTVFLKEGDSVPPNVDPETIRWIPANHPFAATSIDIDEDIAKSNVYQKDGVPFRVKAEHEALQKKLQSLRDHPQFKSSEKPQEPPENSKPANNKNNHIASKSGEDFDISDSGSRHELNGNLD
ncbi:protein MULTIPLE CHLOROPLAST DIVISION SITE 1 isoform X2 [Ananas comosus]|uniref:Protein MULTIPLE CHLOROPLAST DIVISION SITE 1 isoform X2 n=1 Tax=Ananas comosus TaxID=4615 RepID=A0A6P5EMZ5_ANACO|nr:protein MULTIPLE CHLOROPLAST DIVISION SITE 1 isoform X2 [Ananas comosus]